MRGVGRIGLLIVIVTLTLLPLPGRERGGVRAADSAAGTPQPGPGTIVPDQGNEHISTLDTPHPPYNSDPPTSGWHIPFIAKWGVHRKPVPFELQVHNLEDGGVLIQYACPAACPDLVKKLERLAERTMKRPEPRFQHLLVAPYPDLAPKTQSRPSLALTAWGRIDRLDAYDEGRITRFIEAYIGVDHHKGRE